MTPLAHRIVKELTLPIKDRTFVDKCGLLKRMDDIHCFEVSAAYEMACDLADTGSMLGPASACEELAFLPAPKTWIEWRWPDGVREGVLLEKHPSADVASCTWAVGGADQFYSQAKKHCFMIGLGSEVPKMKIADKGSVARFMEGETESQARGWTALIYSLLAIINTPRTIGRRQHVPHRGLERDLLKQQKVMGRFPLHSWTEIVLECTPPKDLSDTPGYEAHLTGKKCLHFCRAHLRVRNGRVEFVSSHWRGDGSLGIKQSRYVLAA